MRLNNWYHVVMSVCGGKPWSPFLGKLAIFITGTSQLGGKGVRYFHDYPRTLTQFSSSGPIWEFADETSEWQTNGVQTNKQSSNICDISLFSQWSMEGWTRNGLVLCCRADQKIKDFTETWHKKWRQILKYFFKFVCFIMFSSFGVSPKKNLKHSQIGGSEVSEVDSLLSIT